MLVNAITFEIRDYSTGVAESFVVEDTEFNYEMIASHRCTRDIHFTPMFDFEFERKECSPKFIEFGEAFEHALTENENVIELDTVDEMVGCFV